jgi:glycosyltransferase involved in cell wall biosynthesis
VLIGQFCETYPPSLDGVGRVMSAYCDTLTQLGHRTVYVAPENPAFPGDPEKRERILYKGFGIPGQAYRLGFPRLTRSFRRAAKNLPFDVVHAHSPFLAGMEARRLAKKSGAPIVATFHSKYYEDFYKATASRLLARIGVAIVLRFFRSCDEVWAVNERTADVLRSYGYQGDIVIMPNGTDPLSVTEEEREEALSRFALREGIPTLIFAGQMDYKKNVESILRACALLLNQGVDFQLILAGRGPNLGGIKALTQELGLAGRTLFTGFVSEQPLLLSLFERSDLLVFPSLYDNAPMVVREAAAMGTPALLIEGSCSAEGVEHNENGFLCENSPESIAKGIKDALPLAKAVGAKARATIPIPWNQIMAQVLARYERLVAQKAGAVKAGGKR